MQKNNAAAQIREYINTSNLPIAVTVNDVQIKDHINLDPEKLKIITLPEDVVLVYPDLLEEFLFHYLDQSILLYTLDGKPSNYIIITQDKNNLDLSRITEFLKLYFSDIHKNYKTYINLPNEQTLRLLAVIDTLMKPMNLSDVLDNNFALSVFKLHDLDHNTDTISKFPRLKGYMAGALARQNNFGEDVADCLAEQYRPYSETDQLPQNLISILLAISKKIDYLLHASFYKKANFNKIINDKNFNIIDEIILLASHRQIEFDLSDWIDLIANNYNIDLDTAPEQILAVIKAKMLTRVNPALPKNILSQPFKAIAWSKELNGWLANKNNIILLKWYPKIDAMLNNSDYPMEIKNNHGQIQAIDADIIEDDLELYFVDKLSLIAGQVYNNLNAEDYKAMLDEFSKLNELLEFSIPKINFEPSDEIIRMNRLTILAHIRLLFEQLFDMSELD